MGAHGEFEMAGVREIVHADDQCWRRLRTKAGMSRQGPPIPGTSWGAKNRKKVSVTVVLDSVMHLSYSA